MKLHPGLISLLLVCVVVMPAWSQLLLEGSNPARNETGIPVTQIIHLKFNKIIDPGSVPESVRVVSNIRGTLAGSLITDNDEISFTPQSDFYANEEISVTILSTLQSLPAQESATPTTVFFTVGIQQSPAIPALFNDVKQHYHHEGIAYPTDATDMDGDGDVDLVFATSAQGLCWYENTPGGYQLRIAHASIPSTIENIIAADFDNDGDMDILVAAFYQGLVLYINNGAMGFTTSQLTTNRKTLFATIADFDLNGYIDIAFGFNNPGEKTYVLYNQGNTVFTEIAISNIGIAQGEAIDIDEDGDWDIVQHNFAGIQYLINNANTFTPIEVVNGNIHYIALADFDHDQDIDIVSAELGKLNLYVNDGDQNFTPKQLESGTSYYSFGVGDLDGDADVDLIVPGYMNFNMLVNDGSNNFSALPVQNTRSQVQHGPEHIVVADLDHDGDLDFISTITNMQLQCYYNVDLGEAYPLSAMPVTYTDSNDDADWGDYDNDGDLDLILLSGVLYENEAGELVEKTTTLPVLHYGSCDWGDYDNDGDLDLLLTGITNLNSEQRNPKTYIYKNDNGNFTLVSSSLTQLPNVWSGEAEWADFNNDGWLDIIYYAFDFSGIYQSDGEGNFSLSFTLPFVYQAGNVVCGDMDADGDLDFAISGWSGSEDPGTILKVYKNNGDWDFSEAQGDFVGRIGGNLSWADMDNDGDLDLIVSGNVRLEGGHSYPQMNVYENRGTNFLSAYASYLADDSGTTTPADFNNDGLADIMATTEGGSSVAPELNLLMNEDIQTFTVADIQLPDIRTRVAAWADYDGDHDLDIFVESKLLRNNIALKNTPPVPPATIQIDSVYNNALYVHWSAGSDAETSSTGLSYQLYMGTQPGQQNIVSASANVTTGFRKVVESGSVKGMRTNIQGLAGGTYYLGVQSVDAAFEGSVFSPEKQVEVIAIQGSNGACRGTEYTYQANPSGAYTWEVKGGTIISGQGSDAVVVRWDAAGKGFVKLSDSQNKNTRVIDVEEAPAPQITGDVTVCTGLEVYSVTGTSVHSTAWSVTGTNSIQDVSDLQASVNWASAGTYNLTATTYPLHKGCFSLATIQVVVDTKPTADIEGIDYACQGEITRYTTTAAQPEWRITTGEIQGGPSQLIDVKWAINKGEKGLVWLKATSENGYCSIKDSLSIFVNPLPSKPYLQIIDDTIVYSTHSPSGIYRWYFNDVPVLEGIYNAVILDISGTVAVEVFSLLGCTNRSDDLNFYLEQDIRKVKLFPNPADEYIAFEWTSKSLNDIEIFIYSLNNNLVRKFTVKKPWPTIIEPLDISGLAPGVYILKLRENDKVHIGRFVKK